MSENIASENRYFFSIKLVQDSYARFAQVWPEDFWVSTRAVGIQ